MRTKRSIFATNLHGNHCLPVLDLGSNALDNMPVLEPLQKQNLIADLVLGCMVELDDLDC